MKLKYIPVFCLGAMMAASCTDTYDPLGAADAVRYITFGVPFIDLTHNVTANVEGRTRADLVFSLNEFNVWGFRRPMTPAGQSDEPGALKEWDEKSIFFTQGADVFQNLRVSVEGGFTNYNNGNFTSWNDTESSLYSFIAGYARTGTFSMDNAVATTGASHGPILRFTLPVTQGGALTRSLDYTNQPDALIAYKFNHRKRDGKVDLSFSHFMTGLRFMFHNHTEKKDLVIKRVTFSGTFYRQAVFDFTKTVPVYSVPTDNTYSGIFTLLDRDQLISPESQDYMGGDNPATLLLLPNPKGTVEQDGNYTLGSNKEITIVYTIGDDGVERTFRHTDFTLTYIPNPNSLHTAHFHFVGDEFMVMFQADNEMKWENGSDNEVNIK